MVTHNLQSTGTPRAFLIASLTALVAATVSAQAGDYVPGKDTVYQNYTRTIMTSEVPQMIALQILGGDAGKLSIEESPDQKTSLEIDLFADAAHAAEAKSYALDTTMVGPGMIMVGSGTGSYQCSSLRLNSEVNVSAGLCVTQLRLLVPRGTDPWVTLNKVTVRGSLHSVPMMMESLKTSPFDSERAAIMSAYIVGATAATKQERVIGMVDVIEIMKLFGSMKADQVAEAFAGRVTDPENAAQAAPYVWSLGQEKALKNLSL